MRRIETSKLYPWLLLSPTLIFFAIWNLVPLLWMVGMSFYNYSLTLGRPPRFIEFRNYLNYLDDTDLWLALSRTFTFVFFSVGLTTLLGGLIGALFWRSTHMPGRRIALSCSFLR
ncbi:MAG: sugar ABC transporter permease [Verrucomicrobia bacterium]|nr:sugar ABC transporter permease [Verrucomicrobiota bacterium]